MAYRLTAKFADRTIRETLREGRNTIGSEPGCEVYIPNPTVSRCHAVVTVSDSSLELQDLGSTNGTILRSQRIDRSHLETGDIFVIGRVVVQVEEVADDDLEVGMRVPREIFDPSGIISVEGLDLTESFSPLDSFALDHLPRLLENLATGAELAQIAQAVGNVLFETMPVTGVEILRTSEEESGVLYSAERPEDETLEREWVEETAANCLVRVQFFRKAAGDYYRPVVQSALWMLSLTNGDRDLQRPSPPSPPARPQPLTVDPEIQRIYNDAERVARGDVGVLIYGESGTGKEVLARFIHAASPRADQPLVTINCASLPRDLLESELFGVERGVATGVEARPGKFETADQGTIFLDEIGDMAIETQAKILRVLQEKEVFRIGGRTPRPARARVVAATNRPIHKMLAEGTFRSDLYHRIATWEVELPPLRRRRRDIANLATYFLARSAQRLGIRVRGISRAALRSLRRYRWPGNIRQLRNEIARAVLFLENRELLDTTRLSPEITGENAGKSGASLSEILEGVEREEILDALERCGGDTNAAAEQLQISRPTLYRRIKNLEIDPQNLPKLGES